MLFCFLVYLPVLVSKYGFSDDYNMLIWSRHNDVDRKVDFAMSNGRPLLIGPQVIAYKLAGDVGGLWTLRALSVAGATVFGLVLADTLCRAAKLPTVHALMLTLLTLVLPSSQIMVGWATLFPYWWSPILATLAARVLLVSSPEQRTWKTWAVVFTLLLLALLNYQPNAMFFFVVLAIATIGRAVWQKEADALTATCVRGCICAFMAMAVAYLMIRLYPVQTDRAALETQWGTKLLYFLHEPLYRSVSLYTFTPKVAWGLINATIALAFIGMLIAKRKLTSFGIIFVLAAVPLAHLPVLMTQSDFAPRRTQFTLAFFVLVIVYLGYVQLLRAITTRLPDPLTRCAGPVAAIAVISVTAFVAQRDIVGLLIRPQQREFDFVKAFIVDQNVQPGDRVYVQQTYGLGHLVRRDPLMEIGSPTNHHFWALPSMVVLAAEEVWPTPPPGKRQTLQVDFGTHVDTTPRRKYLDMNNMRYERQRHSRM